MKSKPAAFRHRRLRHPAAGRKKEMTSRWKRFYGKQMEDGKLRELVETELENLQLGVQIAKLRAAEKSVILLGRLAGQT